MSDKPDRTRNTSVLPEMRRAAWACASPRRLRATRRFSKLPGLEQSGQAWAHTQGQLACIARWKNAAEMVQLRTGSEVEAHAARWRAADAETCQAAHRYLLSLEGADSILSWGIWKSRGGCLIALGRSTMGRRLRAPHR